MRYPIRVLPLVCLCALLASAQQSPEISFCPAGVQADGFINWSQLPKAPPDNGGQAPAVTATIPVSGVSGLSATVQIASSFPSNPTQPYYSAVNASDFAANINDGTPLTISFSKPVRGVSVVIRAYGRGGHNFIMTANDVNGNSTSATPPPPAQVTTNGWDYSSSQYVTAPLAIRSSAANLTTVTFGFFGDDNEYGPFELINLRVESGSGPDLANDVPKNGLTEWFRADKVTVDEATLPYFPNSVSVWPDQSGNGTNASTSNPSGAPAYTLDGPNCTPVLSFNGSQSLRFNQPINGWTGMTAFLAAQAYSGGTWSSNAPLFWDQSGAWGETYVAPFQGTAWFRFGTGQVNNQPTYQYPVFKGGDFTITTTIHNLSVDSLYVNGVLALQQSGKFTPLANNVPTAAIGSGVAGSFFTGNVGEILVYNRALSDSERERVEHYLITKYGVH